MACLRATLPVSKVVGSTEQGSREGKGPGEKGKGKAQGSSAWASADTASLFRSQGSI